MALPILYTMYTNSH